MTETVGLKRLPTKCYKRTNCRQWVIYRQATVFLRSMTEHENCEGRKIITARTLTRNDESLLYAKRVIIMMAKPRSWARSENVWVDVITGVQLEKGVCRTVSKSGKERLECGIAMACVL